MWELIHTNINVGHILFMLSILCVRGLTPLRQNRAVFIDRALRLKAGNSSPIINEGHLFDKEEETAMLQAHNESLELYHKFRAVKDGFISKQLNSALDILSNALRLYGPSHLFSSFNGGKDAVVIMHLLRAATAKYSFDCGVIYRPQFVYFTVKGEFPEVLEHIKESEEMFTLKLHRYHSGISQGLIDHINSLDSQKTPAFVLGTRKGDPNCGDQQFFAPSR